MKNPLKKVIIFTDGGCEPNPGRGGYGIVIIYMNHRKELSDGYRLTTNNRMELLAAIKGLESLNQPCKVNLFSDSEYVVNAFKKGWFKRWKARNWHRQNNKMVANYDLWILLDSLVQKHQVDFKWVKSHNNIPENDRCHELAMHALKSNGLMIDEFFESLPESDPKEIQ